MLTFIVESNFFGKIYLSRFFLHLLNYLNVFYIHLITKKKLDPTTSICIGYICFSFLQKLLTNRVFEIKYTAIQIRVLIPLPLPNEYTFFIVDSFRYF